MRIKPTKPTTVSFSNHLRRLFNSLQFFPTDRLQKTVGPQMSPWKWLNHSPLFQVLHAQVGHSCKEARCDHKPIQTNKLMIYWCSFVGLCSSKLSCGFQNFKNYDWRNLNIGHIMLHDMYEWVSSLFFRWSALSTVLLGSSHPHSQANVPAPLSSEQLCGSGD